MATAEDFNWEYLLFHKIIPHFDAETAENFRSINAFCHVMERMSIWYHYDIESEETFKQRQNRFWAEDIVLNESRNLQAYLRGKFNREKYPLTKLFDEADAEEDAMEAEFDADWAWKFSSDDEEESSGQEDEQVDGQRGGGE